ncbi:MAG: hypothetical protein H0T62_01530 [Parachlamydiaceae bacterium]|nr:hypothetical protein [Parachlamydiaceae bacterium]
MKIVDQPPVHCKDRIYGLNFKLLKRRHFLLVEVLIAFAFVVAALLPLMHPHFYIYQQQSRFIDKIELDIAVNNFYGNILQRLQTSEISWGQIESKRASSVTDQLWGREANMTPNPFKGNYKFRIEKSKTNKDYGVYLLELTLEVVPNSPLKKETEKKKKPAVFTFKIFATRLFQPA